MSVFMNMIYKDYLIRIILLYGTCKSLTMVAVLRPAGGKMNTNHRQKSYDKLLKKSANSFLILILAMFATFIGIQFGNLWYHLDIKIIDNIDTDNFKKTISFSLPIIETVYNSGKSSVSFSNEIKEFFTATFGFDLQAPASIFSAQSALFRSYNKMLYVGEQDPEGLLQSQDADHRKDPGDAYKPGQGTVPEESGTGQQSGDGSGKNDDEDGKGGLSEGGSAESSIDTDSYADAGEGSERPGPGDSGRNDATVLQGASSISWEMEDEEKDDKIDIVEVEQIAIRNNTRYKIDVAQLLKQPLDLDLSKKGPRVLIYHTHTSESYVLKESDLGRKDVPSFNSNPKYNVVRVGEELARHLKKYGIETLHNGTVHDKVRDAAYSVSVDTLKSYKKSYPSIQVYIDIHRDAVKSDKPKLRLTKEINGKNCAQIMFVVGAEGTLPHPKWRENLSFVLKLQQKLNEKYPGLARPVWIVEARYNQHISPQSILVEVGGDGNLLSECLESTRYLAEALNEVINEWGRDGS